MSSQSEFVSHLVLPSKQSLKTFVKSNTSGKKEKGGKDLALALALESMLPLPRADFCVFVLRA